MLLSIRPLVSFEKSESVPKLRMELKTLMVTPDIILIFCILSLKFLSYLRYMQSLEF